MLQLERKVKFGLISGVVISILTALLACFWEQFMYWNLHKELVLGPNSPIYKFWYISPIPIYFRVYFFNWTNPQDYGTPGYKPKFVEMGPYTFYTTLEKVNITWNDHNGTVTFKRMKRYWFEPSMSAGSLDDNVTSINAVAASAAYVTKTWTKFLIYPLSMAMRATGQQISWTHTVRELMFDGLNNKLHQLANTLPDMTDMPKLDKFGWFYKHNNSVEPDVYNMDTGQNDINTIGKLLRWNYKSVIGHYRGKCDLVNGWYGEIWPPRLTKETKLVFITTEMCRPLTYYFSQETESKGIPVYKYTATEMTLDNGTRNADNNCYNSKNINLATGVFNRTSCSYGAPLFFSFPHFYAADKSYTDAVIGMKPNQEKHGSYVKLDPNTGAQTEVVGKFQLNMLVEKNTNLALFSKSQQVYFPILWCEMNGQLTDNFLLLIRLFNIGLTFGRPTLLAISAFSMTLVICIVFINWNKKKLVRMFHRKISSVRINSVTEDESAEKLMMSTNNGY